MTLTVTDNRGGTDTVTHTVVATAPNQDPVAAFSSSTTNLKVDVDGTASSDPDGTIASYAWNFGDGGTSGQVSPSHTYAAAGTYTISLTVTDNDGATNTVTHQVTVAPANQSPTAAFTTSTTNLKVTVNGSGSSDPDGTIASYAWTYGDGGTGSGVS